VLLFFFFLEVRELTGVGERSLLGVEVALSLLGDDHGVLTLVLSSHCDVMCVCVCWFGCGVMEEEGRLFVVVEESKWVSSCSIVREEGKEACRQEKYINCWWYLDSLLTRVRYTTSCSPVWRQQGRFPSRNGGALSRWGPLTKDSQRRPERAWHRWWHGTSRSMIRFEDSFTYAGVILQLLESAQ